MLRIGYTYQCAMYCDDCFAPFAVHPESSEVGTIFADDECDYPYHCSECHEFLGGRLTSEGFRYIKENYLTRNWRDNELLNKYMDVFDQFDWYFIPTHYGFMDPSGNLKDLPTRW